MQLLCKKRSLAIQQYSSKGFRLWRRKKRIFGGKGPMDPSPNFLPNNNFQSVCGPPKCYYFFKILFSNGYIDHWESKSWYPKISSNLLNTLVYRGIFWRRRRRKKFLPLSTRYFGIFFGSEGGGVRAAGFRPGGG